MPKTLKLGSKMRIIDVHPRAERLLQDANALTPEQNAFICGLYCGADGALRASSNTDELVLSRHAIDVLKGVASRLANAHRAKPDLLDEATTIMRTIDAAERGQ